VEHLDRFFEVLVARTAQDYPDYSCNMILRLVPTVPDGDQRLKIYQKLQGIYPRRPDLQGRILLAVGDEFHQQKKNDKALAAYQQAANQCVDLAVIVMKAAERVESLFVEAKRPDLTLGFYESLFRATKKPRDTAFRSATAWYKIGKRLADLLTGAGKNTEAANLTKLIEG
jgi:tetratricopeptide (TPR) repeat protein